MHRYAEDLWLPAVLAAAGLTMLNTPVFGAAKPSTFNDMILLASQPQPVIDIN